VNCRRRTAKPVHGFRAANNHSDTVAAADEDDDNDDEDPSFGGRDDDGGGGGVWAVATRVGPHKCVTFTVRRPSVVAAAAHAIAVSTDNRYDNDDEDILQCRIFVRYVATGREHARELLGRRSVVSRHVGRPCF